MGEILQKIKTDGSGSQSNLVQVAARGASSSPISKSDLTSILKFDIDPQNTRQIPTGSTEAIRQVGNSKLDELQTMLRERSQTQPSKVNTNARASRPAGQSSVMNPEDMQRVDLITPPKRVSLAPYTIDMSPLVHFAGEHMFRVTPEVQKQKIHNLNSPLFMCKMVQINKKVLYILGADVINNRGLSSEVGSCNIIVDTESQPIVPRHKRGFNAPARTGFGACLSVDRLRIYICGGYDTKLGFTNVCEFYSISNDMWKKLPSLNFKKGGAGLCEFNKVDKTKWLYCFGGIDGFTDTKVLNQVERLNLNGTNNTSWELLDFKMDKPLTDMGVFQSDDDKLMILGGSISNLTCLTIHFSS
jgi:hypothetical protein